MCLGEHSGLLEHGNANKEQEDWALYPNDNVVIEPPVVAVGIQHPPMQKPPPM